MQITPIPLEGRVAEAANFEVLITHEDLTNVTNDGTQTLTVPIAAKMSVRGVRAILDVPFEDASDSAHAGDTVTVGDGGSATRFFTSTQVNTYGTPVGLKSGVDIEYPYTVDDTIDITFTPGSGKNLAALTAGQLRLQLQINDERAVAPAP